MAAGPDAVSGTHVSGSTNVTGGTDHINGPVATLADDVASINAARQSALTIPTNKAFQSGEGIMGKVFGGKTTDGGY